MRPRAPPTLALLALVAALALSGCAGTGDDGKGGGSTSTTGGAGSGGAGGGGSGTWTGGAPPGTTSPPPTQSPTTQQGTAGPVHPRASVFEDFEAGLGDWAPDGDVPADPNRPGQPVAWNITQGDNGWEDHVHAMAHPTHGARFRLDGRQDDGAIWLERTVQLQAGQAYRVTVTFQAWSPSESFNVRAHVLALAAAASPEAEGDFPEPSTTGPLGLRQPLDQAEGWKEYSFEGTTAPLPGGRLHVAVGIAAVWETELQHDIDAIRIVTQAV